MKKQRLNLKEYLYYAGMKQCVFSERSGVSAPVLHKILNGGDYNMSTTIKLLEASNNIICPIALLKALKPKEEQKLHHPKNCSSTPPKKKNQTNKFKNLS